MSERKSGRARKAVDYTKYGGGDDFDDDFADSTPPASKKARLSNKENKEKKNNKKEQKVEKEVNKSSSDCKSVDDRRYERELQEALQLSMSQSDPQQGFTGSPVDTDRNGAPPIIIEDEEQSVPSPILPAIDNPPVLTKMVEVEDDIEVLETSIEEVPSSRRTASKAKKYIDSDSESAGEDFEIDLRKFLSSPLTPKVKKKKDEDSDFAPNDGEDDSLSDDDEDDEDDYNPEDSDSDFGSSKKKTTKKIASKSDTSKGSTKNAKVAKITTGSAKSSTGKSMKTTKTTGASKAGIIHTPLAASSPSSKLPGSGLTAHKSPNWKPPGAATDGKSPTVLNTKTKVNNVTGKSPAGLNTKSKPTLSGGVGKSPLGGVNIKSPSSGLRIGLSRNMKLKPLHPNMKTHN